MRKLRVESSEKEDGNGGDEDSSIFPDRPGEPDCIYYLRTGMCGYGATCRFNHPSNIPLQVFFNEFSYFFTDFSVFVNIYVYRLTLK